MLIQLGNCWGSEEENCINCENPVSKESWSGHRGYTTTSHLLCMQASFPHTAYGEQGTNGMVFIEKMKKSLFLFSFLAIAHCLQSLKWACSPFTLLQRHRGAEPTAHSCSDGSIPSIISRDSQSLSCGYHGPSQTNSAVGAVLPMALLSHLCSWPLEKMLPLGRRDPCSARGTALVLLPDRQGISKSQKKGRKELVWSKPSV